MGVNHGAVGNGGTQRLSGGARHSWWTADRSRMPRAVAAAALLGVLALTACSSDTPSTDDTATSAAATSPATEETASVAPTTAPSADSLTSADKSGAGVIRTDLEPLIVRFPALGEPVSAQWSGDALGNSDDPSPHTGWIEAVVEVTPDVANQLSDLGLSPADTPPALTPEIAALVPQGDLLTAPAMASSFALASGQVRAYLVSGTNTIVISAVGEN